MKTSVIEVHDMLSVLSVVGVEKRIGEVPGVESVTVNFAAGSATVRFDETRLNIVDIKSAVRQSEYESLPAAASAGKGHEGHAMSAVASPPANTSASKPSPAAAPAPASSAVEGQPKAAQGSPPAKPKSTPDAAAVVPASAGSADDQRPDKAAPKKS